MEIRNKCIQLSLLMDFRWFSAILEKLEIKGPVVTLRKRFLSIC